MTSRCIRDPVLIVIRWTILYGPWTSTSIGTSILKMETLQLVILPARTATQVADAQDDVRHVILALTIVTCATTTTVPTVLTMRSGPAPAVRATMPSVPEDVHAKMTYMADSTFVTIPLTHVVPTGVINVSKVCTTHTADLAKAASTSSLSYMILILTSKSVCKTVHLDTQLE